MTLQKIFNTIAEHNATVETLGYGHKIKAKILFDGYREVEAVTYREALHNLSKEYVKQFVDKIKTADFKKNYDNNFTVVIPQSGYTTTVDIEMDDVR